jgi:uracil phosphoribosyltransferase
MHAKLMAMDHVTVVEHPLLARALSVMRSADTPRAGFRAAMADAAGILAYEALRDLPVSTVPVRTPLEDTTASVPARPVAVVAILRAGLGMVDGFLRLVPDAAVGHLGMRRNEKTLVPEDYYESLPAVIGDATVFVVDPMLATGGSAVAALRRLRRAGARDLRLVCVVAAPEGLAAVRAVEPELPITVAVLDRCLDDRGYIRPGLGDAGDRIFGTD